MFLFVKPIRCIGILIAFGLCLASTESMAEIKKKKKKAKKVPTWNFEQTYRLLGTFQEGEAAKELTNPNNQFYQLPYRTLLMEFRPELQGTYRRYKLVLRPRASVLDDFRDIPPLVPAPPGYKQPKDQTFTSEAFLNEAYLAGSPASKWQYVIGLQNFQWGPAELASPSNPLFRDLGLSKTYFFETRGKGLLRVNYSPSGKTTYIFITEAFENGSKRDASDPYFRKKGLIKAEFADASQTNYFGLVMSAAEQDKPQWGSYANYEAATGFTVYYDAQARQGTQLWKPNFAAPLPLFEQNLKLDTSIQSASLLGLRYVTVKNIDYRLEGFYETSAWTAGDRTLARGVLANAPTLDNASIYLNPGSFFPGQKFAYASVRIPEWGYKDSFTLSLRDLYSITDRTQAAQMSFDTFIGDSVLLSTGVTSSFGKADGELTQGYSWRAFLTFAWTL